MSRPEVLVGRPGIGAKLGSVGYGYRLRFYTTDDGLKAAFELALDPEGTTWEQASDEYAPDSTADTDVGATVAAAGITIPGDSELAGRFPECSPICWNTRAGAMACESWTS